MSRFIGIRRKTEFSPNHVENDLMIINKTAERLQELGAEVAMVDEGELTSRALDGDFIFSMVQGPKGIKTLGEIANTGHPVIINSPDSVSNCYRINMVKLLPENGIPFPQSVILPTGTKSLSGVENELNGKMWVKRGDVHAVHREDVVLAYDREEAMMILREFRQRDIETAVLQEHIEGDTVKFYAVRESSFFHSYHLNGTYHTPFDLDTLKQLAARSSEILGLYVYGGDAIVMTDGTIKIIDINDWPSFAPVREEASKEIARLIFRKAKEYGRQTNAK